MKKQTDITEEFIGNATPGVGHILYESGYNKSKHEEEFKTAQRLLENFGGEIVLLAEQGGTYGAKRSDFEWRGRYWELKTLKSEKSVDSALRKAIGQIYEKPGGVILDFGKNTVRLPQIESAVKSRIEASCRFKVEIMIVCSGTLQNVLRYT